MLIRVNKNIETSIYTWLLIAIAYSMLLLSDFTLILSLLLFASWIIFSKKHFDLSSRKTRLVVLFAALYVIYIIGLAYTTNPLESISTFESKAGLFIFPLILGTTKILDQTLLEEITNHFLIASVISSVAGLIYGAFNYLQTGDPESLTGKNILFFPGFRPFLMGLFCLTAIILSFEKLSTISISIGTKRLLYTGIILLSATIILLSIRLIVVCWLFVLLYYINKFSINRQYRILLITVPMLIIVVSAFTIPTVRNQWTELFDNSEKSKIVLDQDSSLGKNWGGKALRIAIWKCSGDILKRHWLAGVGTGDVQDSLQQVYENRKFYFASRYNRYNAHNQYIQISLATGLAGLLILLLCILYPLWHYRKRFSSNLYLLFLLIFAFICFSESILEANKGIIWYSFFNSIFAFGYLKSDVT